MKVSPRKERNIWCWSFLYKHLDLPSHIFHIVLSEPVNFKVNPSFRNLFPNKLDPQGLSIFLSLFFFTYARNRGFVKSSNIPAGLNFAVDLSNLCVTIFMWRSREMRTEWWNKRCSAVWLDQFKSADWILLIITLQFSALRCIYFIFNLVYFILVHVIPSADACWKLIN